MRQSSTGRRRCDDTVSVLPTFPTTCDRVRLRSESLYRVLQQTAARANLGTIDTPARSNYAAIEVVIPKNHFEKQHLSIELGKGESHVRFRARETSDGRRSLQLRSAPISRPVRI